MRRREFIAALGSAAAWPLAARAQQPATPVVGFLHQQTAERTASIRSVFRAGLESAGFIDGRNVTIEYRWAEGRNERLGSLAADLVRRRVDVIVAGADSPAFALKAVATTIPVVCAFASDPVVNGFVAGLNRPGTNFTGAYRFGSELEPKRLELLHEVVPPAAVIDLLVNPTGAITVASSRDIEVAARALGRQIRTHTARDDAEIETVFMMLSQLHAAALLIMGDSFFTGRSGKLGEMTARRAIPAAYVTREFTLAGGLMNYGALETDAFRMLGIYAGRILKGENPADLPVLQSTKVELVLNLKTAKALGLTFPTALLVRADEVIE